MASDFLNKLKQARDNGIVDSEAANLINEISKTADRFTSKEDIEKIKNEHRIKHQKNVDDGLIPEQTEETMIEAKKENDLFMEKQRKEEKILKQTAILLNIEFEVKTSILSMLEHIESLEQTYDPTDPDNLQLYLEIKTIKDTYESFNIY